MLKTELRLSELGLIAATRGLLGAGIGLLAAERLDNTQRKRLGRTLVAIGILTTLPLMMIVLKHRRVAPG